MQTILLVDTPKEHPISALLHGYELDGDALIFDLQTTATQIEGTASVQVEETGASQRIKSKGGDESDMRV